MNSSDAFVIWIDSMGKAWENTEMEWFYILAQRMIVASNESSVFIFNILISFGIYF